MDAYDLLISQFDEKVTQLKDYLSEGKSESYEEYKRICGEIKGLLIARGYTLDLKHTVENADD